LGTVAGSPSTTLQANLLSSISSPAALGSLLVRVGTGISSVFPSFRLGDWLSDQGVQTAQLLQDLQGCQSVALELLSSPDLVNPGWNSTWYFDAFNNLTACGGQPFAGPMLVLQGTADPSVDPNGTTAAVNATCKAYAEGQLEYATFEGVSHVPVLYAGQQVWLDWIAERFNGVQARGGCQRTHYQPQLSVGSYQKEVALFLQYPMYGYETA